MSDTGDSGPPLEVIVGWIPAIVKGRYMGLTAWTMFLWDHAILFDQEVEYIWRKSEKKMLMNKIYLVLRYTGLALFALNYFVVPKTDQFCGVWKHLTLWPQLIDTALSECAYKNTLGYTLCLCVNKCQ